MKKMVTRNVSEVLENIEDTNMSTGTKKSIKYVILTYQNDQRNTPT